MERAAKVPRRSWHAYRWRFEPLFSPAVPGIIIAASAILYVMVSGLTSGDPYGASLLAIVLLVAAIAALIFLLATRESGGKGSY